MIKLNNVSKSYVSKTKQRVDALKGVSFDLPNKGMVFILGKSGSGKSTLLNLLGGLDAPTNGEIYVDGVSMKDFASTDYDSYRNSYVGFIFQEYNLLDDFNVKDNIAIALQLSEANEIDEKVKRALQQVELNDDYLLRRVDEMSGGEKQRIAIARCIVKDSNMVLADEPTGNLDSATGESIWNILKKLSQSKLVVVVSHDRESAEKYGDRILEIADGKITSDVGVTNSDSDAATDKKQEPKFDIVRKKLPIKSCFKMGLNNLAQRKVKTVSVILLSIFTILTLLITEMFMAFSPPKTIAKFVKRYEIPYFTMQQYKRDDDGKLSYHHILRDDTIDYLEQKSDYIIDGIVENKQQMLDFGFTFIGEPLELTNRSYYITSDELNSYIDDWNRWGRCYYVDDDGEKVVISSSTPLEVIIGKEVYIPYLGYNEEDLPIIAGIIDSEVINEKTRDYVPSKFVRNDYKYKPISSWPQCSVNKDTSNAVMQFGSGSYQEYFQIESFLPNNGIQRAMLTANGMVSDEAMSEMTLNDDEIVLTYELYQQLFDANPKWSYVNQSTLEMSSGIKMPVEFNQKLELKFYNSVSGDLIVDLGEVKLVGIVFQRFYRNYEADDNFHMSVSERNCEKLQEFLTTSKTILVKTDSVTNLSAFLSVLDKKYDTRSVKAGTILFSDDVRNGGDATDAYWMKEEMETIGFVLMAICVLMIVVLLLLVINLISFNITNRKREIGILSALGTSNKDLTKIFIFETLLIATISFVITLILSFVTAYAFNTLISLAYVEFLEPFYVDLLTILVLTVSSFGLLLLASWIPIRKIAKLKPIDAIRKL